MSSAKKISAMIIVLCAVLLAAGPVMSQETAKSTENQKEAPVSVYEGIVKVGLGPYFFIQGTEGFDVAVQGKIQSGDASSLVGRTVRVKGEILVDMPSIMRADSIEVKESSGSFKGIYNRTEDLVLPDFVDSRIRETYKETVITSALNTEEWEGKGKIRVYGAFQPGTPNIILLTDDKNKEIGKIVVDKTTDYAAYYMKKLRLFNKFWFYCNVKETVEKSVRTKSRELFHADVIFSGLF